MIDRSAAAITAGFLCAAVAAAAPGVIGAIAKTPAAQAVGSVLANPVAQGVLRGTGVTLVGLNGVNAARNGIATAEALANGRYLDALESATLTVENAAGAYGGARGLFAKPRTTTVPDEFPEGSFSISNWRGYPDDIPKPPGPFRVIDGDEYNAARAAADAKNNAIRNLADHQQISQTKCCSMRNDTGKL